MHYLLVHLLAIGYALFTCTSSCNWLCIIYLYIFLQLVMHYLLVHLLAIGYALFTCTSSCNWLCIIYLCIFFLVKDFVFHASNVSVVGDILDLSLGYHDQYYKRRKPENGDVRSLLKDACQRRERKEKSSTVRMWSC